MESINKIELRKGNCLELIKKDFKDLSINLTLTDIPYGEVNRKSNGLRNLDKGKADEINFEIKDLLNELYRVTKSTIIIFCGKEQLSEIYSFFNNKQKQKLGTTRQIIWEKSNPSPMNAKYIYLSGVENAVWFKKKSGTFNPNYKNTIFKFPVGRNKYHPTQKNLNLFEELIKDNSNEKDIVLDCFAGGGTTGIACRNLNRNCIMIEQEEKYCNNILERLKNGKY